MAKHLGAQDFRPHRRSRASTLRHPVRDPNALAELVRQIAIPADVAAVNARIRKALERLGWAPGRGALREMNRSLMWRLKKPQQTLDFSTIRWLGLLARRTGAMRRLWEALNGPDTDLEAAVFSPDDCIGDRVEAVRAFIQQQPGATTGFEIPVTIRRSRPCGSAASRPRDPTRCFRRQRVAADENELDAKMASEAADRTGALQALFLVGVEPPESDYGNDEPPTAHLTGRTLTGDEAIRLCRWEQGRLKRRNGARAMALEHPSTTGAVLGPRVLGPPGASTAARQQSLIALFVSSRSAGRAGLPGRPHLRLPPSARLRKAPKGLPMLREGP